ncbi:helix-turn-helix domain-containing protein [Bauldia sp.]|uniref:helix-turn-helix domain-containing protein n=1 Tax=Bauldia sp. TaxID=2575872 RepID=UPI003BAD75E3
MRPQFEKVTVPPGASWALLDRRLEDGIPFEWHYHPEYELTLTLNSRGQRFIGDSVEMYDDGDLVLLGPNLPHTWFSADRYDDGRPHHALVMWFTGDWASGLVDGFAEMRSLGPMLAEAGRGVAFSPGIAKTARGLIEELPDLSASDRLVRLMSVLALLSTDRGRTAVAAPVSGRATVTSPDQPRIQRVLDHIHAHYREPISVSRLAEVAALSPSGFHRLFRRHTRLTLTAYLAQLRIGQACALLASTDRPIAHIADEVGYANLANFNRRFRAAKGMTPRDYRRRFATKGSVEAPHTRMGMST